MKACDNVLLFMSPELPERVGELISRGELSRAEEEVRRLLPSLRGAEKLRLEFEL